MHIDADCTRYRDALDARLDGELQPDEAANVDAHLATCESCAREYATLSTAHRLVSENLPRHAAPDVLRARIRGALAETMTPVAPVVPATPMTPVTPVTPVTREAPRAPTRRASPWWRLAAAGIAIAVASSALTYSVAGRRNVSNSASEELFASHIRSLMPGHLTDVVSTNQHNVKPWFDGRVDVSPSVPNLDSLGFPLVGGRMDYVAGRAVPVVVYSRRQHMINVYEWAQIGSATAPSESTRNGYHLVGWRRDGLEYRAVSDLNTKELDEFVAAYTAAR
ncbi:MAG: anti-sigma factor family protein [Gemmatimonadaceae bacterium]